ncbi:MAG: molybdenum cofactor biosynthesis protein MoaE [Planctomycetes bacterium]|nr:molybdenum cofactor biosynthesis protein MoaE [Planctomycetota bacterium]
MIRLQVERLDAGWAHDAVRDPRAGAICCFEGTTREVHEGRPVASLAYEAYQGMAEREMAAIVAEARRRFPGLVRMCLAHRLGEVPLAEASVLVAASAPHRAEAFEACRFAIDALKASVPIWKKESYRDGGDARWVVNREARGAGETPAAADGREAGAPATEGLRQRDEARGGGAHR